MASDSRIFVSGLPSNFTENDIRSHFVNFGEITDVYIPNKSKSKKKNGVCYVGFLDTKSAKAALNLCNKSFIGTNKISVKFAKFRGKDQPKNDKNKAINGKNNIKDKKETKVKSKEDIEFENFVKLATYNPGKIDDIGGSDDDLNEDSDMEYNTKLFLGENDMESDKDGNSDDGNVDDRKLNKNSEYQQEINELKDTVEGKYKQNIFEDISEIFIRNLPFILTEEQLFEFFKEYGSVKSVYICLDDFGKSKGYGFVEFNDWKTVEKIFEKYWTKNIDKSKKNKGSNVKIFGNKPEIEILFHGRNIKVSLSNYKYKDKYSVMINGKRKEITYNDLDDELKECLSFKQLKKLKLKSMSKNDITWNTFFVPNDSVLRETSKRFNVKKSELLDINNDHNNQNNIAITTTLAETKIINQTKLFFKNNGINVKLFQQSKSQTVRSRNIILVKNISYKAKLKDILSLFSKYGTLNRCLMPETKSCAVIEYNDHKNAKKAFNKLAYYNFKNLPLFLEWAPVGIISENATTIKDMDLDNQDTNPYLNEGNNNDDIKQNKSKGNRKRKYQMINENDTKTKIIVKNIAFEANDKEIKKLFGVYGIIKSCRLPKKHGGGHRGFGFIEFDTPKEAHNAINSLMDSHFYGRKIVLEWAKQDNMNNKKTRIE